MPFYNETAVLKPVLAGGGCIPELQLEVRYDARRCREVQAVCEQTNEDATNLTTPTEVDPQLVHVFVYGTLKQGESRSSCWPYVPGRVRTATVTASLYDLGDYPAMVPGDDCVVGELWEWLPDQMAETLRVLDQIEGYAGCEDDLYKRITIDCRPERESLVIPAFTYLYFRPDELDPEWRMKPVQGVVRWPLRQNQPDLFRSSQ